MRQRNRLLHLLYQPWKWLIVIPFYLLNTLILTSSGIALSFFTGSRFVRIIGVFWARINSALTPVRVIVKGRENIESGRSYVIVSNHRSYYDIPVIYGWLGMDFRWVAKRELRAIPFFGLCMERMGHVFVDRSDTGSALASINSKKEQIREGTSIFFFPEGTIFDTVEPGPFKKGAFRFALDMKLPLLPVTISGTDDILPFETWDLYPGRARLPIHKPIETEGYGRDSLEALAEISRKAVASGLT
jgi:1-acyl-sn-glycerol-3-phosphate acyltransferase